MKLFRHIRYWLRYKSPTPRRLWFKATHYQIPVRTVIEGSGFAGAQTHIHIPRWERWRRTGFVFSMDMRLVDSEWQNYKIKADEERDHRGRLLSLTARIPVPGDSGEPFYIDSPSLTDGHRFD